MGMTRRGTELINSERNEPHARLSDWLALNGVTAGMIMPLLNRPVPAPGRIMESIVLSEPVAPADIAARMSRALPALAPLLERTLDLARFDLAPDRKRFPRAFTLHDDGSGRPFVSCPQDGTVADLLRLAHELGHACQIVAAGSGLPGPVMREAAAYVAEGLIVAEAQGAADPLAHALAARHAADTDRIARRDGAHLLAALREFGADPAYRYNWNYPVARRVALSATTVWPAEAVVALFASPPRLADALARSTAQVGKAD